MAKFADVCLSSAQRWEVGKTYLTRGTSLGRSKVRILATDLRGDFPICGAYMNVEGTEEEPLQWRIDGTFSFNRDDGPMSLDLTTDLAP